jgi:membrane-bound metal-dependent hydrolase YbcI (DUF457 family)
VDFVLMPVGWDVYLRAHEIGTHSIPGLMVTGLGSAALVRLVLRTSRFGVLAAAAIAGAASHVIADVFAGARIRVAWPLIDAIPSAPLVAMGDPWPIAILAAGALAFWSRRIAPRQGTARLTLLALAGLFCLKAVLLAVALRTFDPEQLHSADRVVEARWASWTQWHIFDRGPEAVRQWIVNARGGRPELVLSWPLTPESRLVAGTRRLDTVRNFLSVHHLAFAVQQPIAAGRLAVLWSDIRYCAKDDSAGDRILCGLWFGGILDPRGRVIEQQVRVGSWIQERPP